MARALSRFSSHKFSAHHPPPPSALISSSTRPMLTIPQAQNQNYWASIEAQIEAQLKKALPVRPPFAVFEPMQSLVISAPKTKAAALCVAACELVGGDTNEAVVAAASALHLMHAAAHTHEQLPLTDRPTLNPNIGPKAHHDFGPNIKLLTADGIVPFGFELLARSVDLDRTNSGRILRVIIEISRAIGPQGTIEGQWEEIEVSQLDGCDDACIGHVCEKKEGELHACGAACGAILGGGSEEEIERLRKCGLHIGMIQGLVNGYVAKVNKKGNSKRVEELKALVVEELKHFKGRNVEPIASLVDQF